LWDVSAFNDTGTQHELGVQAKLVLLIVSATQDFALIGTDDGRIEAADYCSDNARVQEVSANY
jgi:hypothetical protein